jgi:hypothetical protein
MMRRGHSDSDTPSPGSGFLVTATFPASEVIGDRLEYFLPPRLALLGCVACLVAVRGLTQQRRDDEARAKVDLEVGLSAADPYPTQQKGPVFR